MQPSASGGACLKTSLESFEKFMPFPNPTYVQRSTSIHLIMICSMLTNKILNMLICICVHM